MAENILLRCCCFDLGCVSRHIPHTLFGDLHTLNAIGVELGFLIVKVCATSVVKGPNCVYISTAGKTGLAKTYAESSAQTARSQRTWLKAGAKHEVRNGLGIACNGRVVRTGHGRPARGKGEGVASRNDV